MKKIACLGSTGSIGTQCLSVAEKYNFKVTALSADKNIDLLYKQAVKFRPEIVAVKDIDAAKVLSLKLQEYNIPVLSGEEGIIKAAGETDAEIVVNSIVGIAGLKPSLAVINAQKTLALSNKETLVTGGELVLKNARQNGVRIIPVDSEHSAIFQAIESKISGEVKKIILTASGGPFFGKTSDELKNVKPEDALRHPNWSMGRKITVDSATLMNKGLEVIEAVHLFGVSAKDIEVVVHRQSILHSAVEFCDNAVIGQFGFPDMRIPIQLALTYPERLPSDVPSLSFTDIKNLTFESPDLKTFTCLATCIEAINRGGLYPAAVNGANEAAVQLFLEGKIGFLDIGKLVYKGLSVGDSNSNFSVEDVFEADRKAREIVLSSVN